MNILKISKKTTSLAFAIAIGSGTLIAANTAFAEPGVYIGAGYGEGRVNNSDFNDNRPAMKAFVGGKFNDYIGIEGAINDYGKAENKGYSAALKGNTAALVGYLPLTKSFDLFIKGGKLWWRDNVTVLDTYHHTLKGDENFYGVGADFHFNKMLAMRAELERYKVELSSNEIGVDVDGSSNVDVASLGVVFSF